MAVLSALRISARPARGFVAMGLVFGSFAALLPVLKAQIGADDATLGLALLGSPLGLVLTLWLAPVFDRRLAALSLPVAALSLGCCMVLAGLAATPFAFFLVHGAGRTAFGNARHRVERACRGYGGGTSRPADERQSRHVLRGLCVQRHGNRGRARGGVGPVVIFAAVALAWAASAIGCGSHPPMRTTNQAPVCHPECRDCGLLCGGIVLDRLLRGGRGRKLVGPACRTHAAGRRGGRRPWSRDPGADHGRRPVLGAGSSGAVR
jgi:hypothetical protein